MPPLCHCAYAARCLIFFMPQITAAEADDAFAEATTPPDVEAEA